MHFTFAFSIHHFISSVGADAGFAAIIGLAVLVLLYFAQARETTTLRDEAISASQRVEQLERRVAAIGGPAVAPPPAGAVGQAVPATAPGAHGAAAGAPDAAGAEAGGGPEKEGIGAPAGPAVTGVPASARQVGARPLASPAASAAASEGVGGAVSPQARPAIPAAPAGVGAPALIDATRLIPVARGGPEGQPADSQTSSGDAPAEDQEPGAPQPAVRESKPAAATALATPPPATAAAGANQPPPVGAGPPNPVGANQAPPVGADPPSPVSASQAPPVGANQPRAVGANGAGEAARTPAGAGNQLPPRLALRPDTPGFGGSISGGRSTRRTRWLPALLALLLVGAVAVVLLVVTSSGSSSRHSAATKSTNAPAPANSFSASSVTVAVLNGTDVSQLAHHVAQKLTSAGYRQSAVATAADQTHNSTIVGFLPGFRADATHVAATLTLPTTAVQAADQSARAIACPPPGACRTNVIVTVGSDLKNTR